MLAGLCSDSIEDLRIAASKEDISEPCKAVNSLLDGLGLSDKTERFNPKGNRLALMFLPGYNQTGTKISPCRDHELHKQFCAKTNYEIHVFGGSAADRRTFNPGGSAANRRSSGSQNHDLCGKQRESEKKIGGWQFFDDKVYENTMVAALIECDVKMGIAMQAGLKKSNDILQIASFDSANRTVKAFKGRTLAEVKKKYGENYLFAINNDTGDPDILVPFVNNNDDTVSFLREISEQTPLEIVIPDPDKAKEAANWVQKKAMERAAIERPEDINSAMLLLCKRRKTLFGNEHDWIFRAHQDTVSQLKNARIFGAYLNGECGKDSANRFTHNSVHLSACMFGTELSLSTQIHKGYRILAEVSKKMLTATSVNETISEALKGLKSYGIPDAMVSLIYTDSPLSKPTDGWVVAIEALGERWKGVIACTRRKFGENVAEGKKDILAVVAETMQSIFVPDSTKDKRNDQNAVPISKVKSQYIVPLLVTVREITMPIGVIQYDLGDHSHLSELPKHMIDFFESYSNHLAIALSRAMYDERLEIRRQVDMAIAKALKCKIKQEAVQTFLEIVIDAVGAQAGHVRLKDDGHLVMAGGVGKYYEAAIMKGRENIPLDDESPSTNYYNISLKGSKRIMVVNDIEKDTGAKKFRERFPKGTLLGDAHRQQKAFINFGIFKEVSDPTKLIGILCIASTEKEWFFTQHKIDALRDIGKEFALLLDSCENKEQLLEEKGKIYRMGVSSAQMAHALGNRITNIIKECESFENIPNELSFSLARIKEGAKYVSRRVSWLRNYITEGKELRSLQSEPIVQTIKYSLSVFGKNRFDDRGITLNENYIFDWKSDFSKDDFYEILDIILDNAISAMRKGGVLEIATICNEDKSICELRVIDKGDGMPLDILQDPFKPFQSNKSGGIGLGLYTAHQLACRNKIEFIIFNNEGINKGVTVSLKFNKINNLTKWRNKK